VQLHDLVDRICRGEADLGDLQRLEELAELVRETSLCGLGQGAPTPVLSTLRHFRDEYLAHVVDRRCPAGACRMGAGPTTRARPGAAPRAAGSEAP
jgi:hypothetical protein